MTNNQTHGTFARWAGRERLFGFISDDGGGEEHFVHVSEFRKNKLRLPEAGDELVFVSNKGAKGLFASSPAYAAAT